jgi:hypothetical protein
MNYPTCLFLYVSTWTADVDACSMGLVIMRNVPISSA